MIFSFVLSLVLSIFIYFVLGNFGMSVSWRIVIVILIMGVSIFVLFYLMNRVDTPPEGARIVTQDELNRAAGLHSK